VAAYAAMEGISLAKPHALKWPNDLMLGERKAAGILCEAGPAGLFIGIGLNCNQLAFDPALEDRATSLALELGREVDRWSVLELILPALRAWLDEADWRSKTEALLWRRGLEASFLPGARGEPLSGTIEGLDEAGSLLFLEFGQNAPSVFAAGELRSGKLS
jgi:BirA family biotin operon repressor/biotin-[acetyl-CoA-carboxylase] ligase